MVPKLKTLGSKLSAARKRAYPKDTQYDFAVRLGISKTTYVKMEQGDLSVSLEKYYRAAQLLGLDSTFEHLFAQERSLFDD